MSKEASAGTASQIRKGNDVIFTVFFSPAIQDDERLSAEEMDERRRQNIAYEYLCHLEEAKR